MCSSAARDSDNSEVFDILGLDGSAPEVFAAEENRKLFQTEELKSNGAKFGRSALMSASEGSDSSSNEEGEDGDLIG